MQLRSALPSYPLQCCKMPCQSIPSQSAAVLILQMKLNAECIQNFPNQYPHLFQWTLHWCSKWPKLIICSAVEAVAVCCCMEVGGPMRPEPDMSSGQGWSVDTDNAGCCSHLPPAIPSYCPLEIPPTPTKLLPDLYRDCIQTAFNIRVLFLQYGLPMSNSPEFMFGLGVSAIKIIAGMHSSLQPWQLLAISINIAFWKCSFKRLNIIFLTF